MSEAKKCPKCGGEIEEERLRSYAGADVVISKPSFWGKVKKVKAYTCTNCGFIELYKEIREKK